MTTTVETGIDLPMRSNGSVGQALSWADVSEAAYDLATRWRNRRPAAVYGIPTGGAPVAVMVAGALSVPLADKPGPGVLVVDDLIDTGRTLTPYVEAGHLTDVLYRKPWSPAALCPEAEERNTWLRFPWERADGAPVDAVLRLIQFIGDDPTRDGLLDTPMRVVRALVEMTSGYATDPIAVLGTTFDVANYDELVVVRAIPFSSLCEHHMLPFVGHATIGYLPDRRVVGLSKLARLVLALARRLQIQERLTAEIADSVMTGLRPLGVGVLVEADHSCMAMRGVERRASAITSAVRGALATDRSVRAEFMALADGHL